MNPTGRNQPWIDSALCAQTDPEAFHPEKGGSVTAAKAMCAMCDVRAECLEFALAMDEREGIWGGLAPRERRKLKQIDSGGPSETDVRIWAVANGVECPPIGRVPASVRDAFEADREAAA